MNVTEIFLTSSGQKKFKGNSDAFDIDIIPASLTQS